MSKIYSPKIVQDGLVMCLDASQNKSYPTTDLPVKDNLILWLDAADDTVFNYSSGTVVSQWRDKSGLNNHVAQSTVASQPNRNVFKNSRKSVYFDGGDGLYNAGNVFPSSTTDYTKIAVVYQTSTLTTGNVISSNTDLGGGVNHAFFFNLSTNISLYHGGTFLTSSVSLSLNTIGIITGTFTYSSGLGAVYVNGSSGGTGTTSNKTIPRDISIGSYVGGNNFTGEICEVLVFSKVLSAIELKQVHTYLGQKWGILNTDRSIIDLSGLDDNGLLGNGTTTAMPAFDYYNKGALRFDGTDDYLSVADNVLLNPATVTVSMWLKRNAYQSSICNFLRRNDRDAYALMATNNTDTVWFRIRNSLAAVVDATTTMPLNTWTNLVGTFDGSNVRVYKDGALANTTANTSAISYSGSTIGDLIIARDDIVSGRYAPINVGATLIYSRALSAAEIAQNYEAQKSKFANTIVQQGLVLNLDVGNPYSYGGAGSTVYDVSPTALSWTTNNIIYNSDPIKYFSYNGSSSWLESSTSSAYDSQTITMESWFYPANLTHDGFLFEKGQVNTQYSIFLSSNGSFYFRTMGGTINNQDTTFVSSTYLTANKWNHVVCTYNGSVKIIYVNGVQVANVNASGTLQTGQVNQYIGKYGAVANNFPFNGRIAQTRVYNIALSAAQALQNYNATKGVFGL